MKNVCTLSVEFLLLWHCFAFNGICFITVAEYRIQRFSEPFHVLIYHFLSGGTELHPYTRCGPRLGLCSRIQPLSGLLLIFLLIGEKRQPLTTSTALSLRIGPTLLEGLERTFPLFQGFSWLQSNLICPLIPGQIQVGGVPVSRHLSL